MFSMDEIVWNKSLQRVRPDDRTVLPACEQKHQQSIVNKGGRRGSSDDVLLSFRDGELAYSAGKTTQTIFAANDDVSGAETFDGVSGTKPTLSALFRSQPLENIAAFDQTPAPRDGLDLDRKSTVQHQGGHRRAMCSPSEYFCLETIRNDATKDVCQARPATLAVNGYRVKETTSQPSDLQSRDNSARKTGHSSRRSGIPVSVHRRSLSSTRENSSEPRFDCNTVAKSGIDNWAGQSSAVHQRQRRTSIDSETTPLSYRKQQNASHSGRLANDARTSWRNMSLRGTSTTGGYTSSPRAAVTTVQARFTSSPGQRSSELPQASATRRSVQTGHIERGRSQLPKHMSQSQPGSRSTSPASRFDYITYKEPASESVVRRTSLSLTHGNSALHHTQNSSPLQISQDGSQKLLKQNGSIVSPLNGNPLSLHQLQTGSEMETAINNALWSRLGDNDAVSETSSVSSGSYNHSSSSSQIPMDISEILALLSSGLWTDRRNALKALQRLLKSESQMSPSEVKKLTDVFSRMFSDPSAKVFTLYMETLPEFLQSHADDIPPEWVHVCLSCLLTRVSGEQFSSAITRLHKALNAARESFEAAHQWSALARIFSECSKLSDAKVRLTFLDYINDLAVSLDSSELSDTESVRQIVMRVVAWASEPKCARIRERSRSIIVALFNVNTPEMYSVLSTSPRSIWDAGYKILQHHMSSVCQESREMSLEPTSRVQHFHISSAENSADSGDRMSSEDFHASLRKAAADIEMLNNFD